MSSHPDWKISLNNLFKATDSILELILGTILDSYPFSQRMDALETSFDARYQFSLDYLNVQVRN